MIPLAWLNPGRWLAVGAVVVALYGAHAWDRHRAAAAARADGAAEVTARWQAERVEAQRAAIAAEQAARGEEQRRVAAAGEIANAAQRQIDQAHADAVRARTESRGLRDAAARAAAACSGGGAEGAAAAESGASASGAGVVLADVLGRADDTAGELAAAFDAARAAGLACQRIYDAVAEAGR